MLRMYGPTCVMPFSETRQGRVHAKRQHSGQDARTDYLIEGYHIPLETFFKEEVKRRHYPKRALQQLAKLHWLSQSKQLVNHLHVVSSKAVLSHFNREKNQLILYDLLDEHTQGIIHTKFDYFETDDVMFIASWGKNILAYTVPLWGDGEAILVRIDLEAKVSEKIQSWDLTPFWTHRHLTDKNEDTGQNKLNFGCSVSPDGKLAVLLGPSEDFGCTWGCKILNTETHEYTQLIEVPGYRYASTAEFHPNNAFIALVCPHTMYSYKKDYDSKDNSGSVVLYDMDKNTCVSTFKSGEVSAEVLKFSPDGRVLLVRLDKKGAIGILQSSTLECVAYVEHNYETFEHSQYMKNVLYKMFPLFSHDSKECAILQYCDTLSMDNKSRKCKWNNGVKYVTKVPIPEKAKDHEKDNDFNNGTCFKVKTKYTRPNPPSCTKVLPGVSAKTPPTKGLSPFDREQQNFLLLD